MTVTKNRKVGRGKGVRTGHGVSGVQRGHWSTLNEHQFLDKLGSHSKGTANRDQLLRGYLSAAMVRDRWGHINASEIMMRVVSEIGDYDKEVCYYCGAEKKG